MFNVKFANIIKIFKIIGKGILILLFMAMLPFIYAFICGFFVD